MICELATYGMVSGFLYQHSQRNHKKYSVIFILLTSMLVGRVVYGLSVYVISFLFGIPNSGFIVIIGAIDMRIPGIILQFLLIPIIIHVIKERIEFYGFYSIAKNI